MHVDLHSPSMNQRDLPEAEDKPQKSLNEKQQENQEFLIRCILQNLGFLGNRPIAACTIYKCLLHWRSFEVERTTVFDRIIQTIGHAIEKMQDSNDVLAYWLSNASTPLLLLQRTLKASAAAAMTPLRRRSSSASLFGRMSQSFRGNPQGVNLSFVTGGVETLRQVPCHVVQSASYRICGENLWNDSRQFEGGDFSIAGFMYPGTTNVKSKLG